METTHDLLHLDKRSLVQWNIVDVPTSFIWIISFFDGAFEYGGGSTSWGYAGENAELPWVEICNFVQYHMFVSYLSCCC
jgi:hypothetical protein